jgi:hypothetical protein
MPWPLSQDYNEAIQSPVTSFSDSELRAGEVACNALGIPLPRSGNFADVYEVRCPNGSRWAVKCFTREVPGLRDRYAEISRHLVEARLGFMVDFSYLEQGIRVHGEWYPILKMEWVEGFTLNEFLRRHLDDAEMLEALLRIWSQMATYLREAEVGHGDLQHGNVLLVPGSSANSLALKLIDYDGMWVPALRDRSSGEVGHPSYQHPQRLRERTYALEVDRFPLLLIATAFRCLKSGGRALWDRHDNGDNLFFQECDLAKPMESSLFAELAKLDDPAAKDLVNHMIDALRGSLESTPLLEEVLHDSKAPEFAQTPRPDTDASETERPPAASGPAWYYRHEGQTHGPVDAVKLLGLAQTGDLLPLDPIWREGEDEADALPAEAALSFDMVPEATATDEEAPPEAAVEETHEPSLAPSEPPAAEKAPAGAAPVPAWLREVAEVEEAAQVPTANDITPPDWLEDVRDSEANPPPPESPEEFEVTLVSETEEVEIVEDVEIVEEAPHAPRAVKKSPPLPPPPRLPPNPRAK